MPDYAQTIANFQAASAAWKAERAETQRQMGVMALLLRQLRIERLYSLTERGAPSISAAPEFTGPPVAGRTSAWAAAAPAA